MRNLSILLFIILLSACGTENTPVYQLTTVTDPAEAGSVSPSGGEFDEGTSVTLQASANEHWIFSGWSGGLAGSQNPDSLIMDSDQQVTAHFVKKDYPLTVTAEGDGTITERVVQTKTTSYEHGTLVELTAEPNHDYWTFQGWAGDMESSDNPVTVEIGGPTQIRGVFAIHTYSVQTSVNGSGSVTVSPDQQVFEHGEEVTLTAEEETGWLFTGWSGDIKSDDNPMIFTIESDTEITANFEEASYSLKVDHTGDGRVNYSPEKESYTHGEEVQLKATPRGDHHFIGWEGDLDTNNPEETLVMTKDSEVTAIFRTVEESLIQRYSSRSAINNMVLSAGIQLQNNLGDDITLNRFMVFSHTGGQIARSDEVHTVKPGSSIGYTLTFNFPQAQQNVSNFEAEWRVTYKGERYVKRAKFGGFGTAHDAISGGSLIELESDI